MTHDPLAVQRSRPVLIIDSNARAGHATHFRRAVGLAVCWIRVGILQNGRAVSGGLDPDGYLDTRFNPVVEFETTMKNGATVC
jgi:hypothetical protein